MTAAKRESTEQRTAKFSGLFVIDRVSKEIDKAPILRRVSCALETGENVLLLGANGAGKSTLLRICAGIMRATSGGVRLASPSRRVEASEIGYAGHQPMLYGELTLGENLDLFAALGEVSRRALRESIARWQLEPHLRKRPAQLSKGLLSRAALCRAFSHKPQFLFLDEPTSALDQASCDIFIEEVAALHSYHQSKLVTLIATHDLARLGVLADRVIVLSGGELIHDSRDGTDASEKTAVIKRSVNVYLTHNR